MSPCQGTNPVCKVFLPLVWFLQFPKILINDLVPQEFFAFAIFLSLDLLITSTQTEHVPKRGRCWHGRSVWVASDWCNLWNLQIADIKCLSRINIPLMNSCLEQHTFSNGLYCHKRGGLAVKLFSNATHTHTQQQCFTEEEKKIEMKTLLCICTEYTVYTCVMNITAVSS